MPKVDVAAVAEHQPTFYPPELRKPVAGRHVREVGRASGLTQFGANVVRVEPGSYSSLRHWHEAEDEFLVVLEGELVLIEDTGETLLKSGDMAAFPAGTGNGHHMLNRSDSDAVFLVLGPDLPRERIHYPGLDLVYERDVGVDRFTRRDGTPY
ncbi:MAG: cupin domain-containing protein [Hyphomicrobiales bacterium]